MGHLSSTMRDVAEREAEETRQADPSAITPAADLPSMGDPPFAAPPVPDGAVIEPVLHVVDKPDNSDAVLYGDDMDAPVPGVSDIVIYSLGNQWRAGRNTAPAFVTRVHEDGTLDLVVIFDAEDFLGLRHVPKATPGERGWMVRPQVDEAAKVRTELETFKEQMGLALFGESERPTDSILAMMDTLAEHIEAIEDRLKATANPGIVRKVAARKKRR